MLYNTSGHRISYVNVTAQCLLQHGQPFQPPDCSPATCRFEAAEALACPLAGNGSFVRQRRAGAACASAFMDGRRRTMPP